VANVAFWHFSDVANLTDDVGSWGQSGLTADTAEATRMTLSRSVLRGHIDRPFLTLSCPNEAARDLVTSSKLEESLPHTADRGVYARLYRNG
jgi:hypothetical protein